MKSLSLKQRLLRYIKGIYPNRIAKGDLDRIVSAKTSYIPENVGRRLRELVNEGLLDVTYVKGHAHYHAVMQHDMDEIFANI